MEISADLINLVEDSVQADLNRFYKDFFRASRAEVTVVAVAVDAAVVVVPAADAAGVRNVLTGATRDFSA